MAYKFLNTDAGNFRNHDNNDWSAESLGNAGYIAGDFSEWTCTIWEYNHGNMETSAFELWTCTATGETLYEVSGPIVGDFAEWSCTIDGTVGEQIHGNLEQWDCVSYAGAEIADSFQLFNGTGTGNLNTITASFALFTADIGGEFNYNVIITDFKQWDAELYAGANVDNYFKQWDGSGTGAAGLALGLTAAFESWTGVVYPAAQIYPALEIPVFTCEATGTVTHVDRITGELPLWDCDIAGDVQRVADIVGSIRTLAGSAQATQVNPSNISADMQFFTGYMEVDIRKPSSIEASFLKWSSNDRMSGVYGPAPYIAADMLTLTGQLTEVDQVPYGILRHNRGEIR